MFISLREQSTAMTDMAQELLFRLQDLREILPDFITDMMLAVSSRAVYIVLPVAIAALFLWFRDRRSGEFILLSVLFGMVSGHFLKDVIKSPRPWITDSHIEPEPSALKNAGDYSMPSGHTVNVVSSFAATMCVLRKNIISLILITFVLTVMFSRLFLGVHTIFDIIAGVAVGLIAVVISKAILDFSDRNYVSASVLMFVVFASLFSVWAIIKEEFDKDISACIGLTCGILFGRIAEHSFVSYRVIPLNVKNNAMKLLTGIVSSGLPTAAAYLIFPGSLGYCLTSFTAGFCILFVSPYLMKKAGLLG